MSQFKTALLAAAAASVLCLQARATPVAGALWIVPEASAQNAVPANLPAAPADVTFALPDNAFSFGTPGDTPANYSVGSFLASGGAAGILEQTPGTLARVLDSFPTDPVPHGTLLRLTGQTTVATGQAIEFNHDDGLSLFVGSSQLTPLIAGPHSPGIDTLVYGGPAGTLPFELIYGECCGPPAYLQGTLPEAAAAVPEPATLALLGVAVLGLAIVRRRHNHAAA